MPNIRWISESGSLQQEMMGPLATSQSRPLSYSLNSAGASNESDHKDVIQHPGLFVSLSTDLVVHQAADEPLPLLAFSLGLAGQEHSEDTNNWVDWARIARKFGRI